MGVINATAAAALPSNTTSAGGLGDLTSDEFLRIVLAELANQDPLEPNDTSAMLDQLSSIRDIEANIDLQENLTSLVDQNEFASAASLIGLVVSGLTENNGRIVDYVSSVRQTDDGAILVTRQGYAVPFKQVDEVITEQELGIGNGNDAGDGAVDPGDNGTSDPSGQTPVGEPPSGPQVVVPDNLPGTRAPSDGTPSVYDPRVDRNIFGITG